MGKWNDPDSVFGPLALLALGMALGIFLIFIGYRIAKEPAATPKPKEAPIVIRLDLTPEAMRACAEAFARYGFWDVRDYECRVERSPKGVVVALYGPGADGKAGEKKRLGEVLLGGGE
jgi:hypothetical protein